MAAPFPPAWGGVNGARPGQVKLARSTRLCLFTGCVCSWGLIKGVAWTVTRHPVLIKGVAWTVTRHPVLIKHVSHGIRGWRAAVCAPPRFERTTKSRTRKVLVLPPVSTRAVGEHKMEWKS